MDYESSLNGAELTVSVEGEIDEFSSRSLRAELDGLIERRRPRRMVLDMSRVSFVDSTGLGLIFGRYKKLDAMGGELALTNVPRQVDKVFSMSGVYSVVEKINVKK